MRVFPIIQLLIVLSGGTSFFAYDGFAQIAVIANQSVPIETIKKTDLYDLYAFEIREWEDGQSVIVFDLKQPAQMRTQFYKFLGKSSSRMKSIWLLHKLSGEGEPPEALPSEDAMLDRVAETPGAIGFIRLPVENDSVKVLAVIE